MSSVGDLDEASHSFHERLLILICSQIHILYIAFVIQMLLLFVAVLSALFADLDEATRTVLFLDFVLLGIVIIPTVVLLYLCGRGP